jgi:hypothetical protein
MLAVVLAGGPIGCQFPQLPEVPQAPEIKAPQVDLPQVPSMPQAPQVQSPSLPSAPSAPKMDVPKDKDFDSTEVCCLRSGPVEAVCGAGSSRCCTIKYERDDCEAKGGLWFHSARGCAGAC